MGVQNFASPLEQWKYFGATDDGAFDFSFVDFETKNVGVTFLVDFLFVLLTDSVRLYFSS